MLYGKPKVEYYQLTQMGLQRISTPENEVDLIPSVKSVLSSIIDMGGTAEKDEIALRTGLNGFALNKPLSTLVDLGYIQAVALQNTPQM